MGIPGVEFRPAWERRINVDFNGLRVSFISRADLIFAKQAAGRPQDLIDIKALRQAEKGRG